MRNMINSSPINTNIFKMCLIFKIRYLVDKLKVVKERYPDLSHSEASKQITDKWHTLSEKKKQVLKNQFDLDMVDYQKKLEKFFREHPEANPLKSVGSAKATAAATVTQSAPANKATSRQDEEPAKVIPPMDLKVLGDRIRDHVKSTLDKLSSSSTAPSEKPANNGYALFAKICQIDLEPLSLTIKEMMSEMVKRWQMLTEEQRKQLDQSAEAIKAAFETKFGHLHHGKVNLDKEGNIVVSAMPIEDKKPR